MMKCIYCNKKTEVKKGTHRINYNEKIIVINNVPTVYCKSCGDEYYSAYTVENLEKILEIVKSYKVSDKKIIVDYKEIMKTLDEISTAV